MKSGVFHLSLFITTLLAAACSNNCAHRIKDITLSAPGQNTLKVRVAVHTTDPLDCWVEYWKKGKDSSVFSSPVSGNTTNHHVVLTNLQPKEAYEYRVVTSRGTCRANSKVYAFSTPAFPPWIRDFFIPVCPDPTVVPSVFRQGYLLIYRRETPGIAFIIDDSAKIVWYHQANGTGFKTAHFTQNKTILAILGNESYPTSYGNEILELSLTGDTLFHCRKGDGAFHHTVHHEALLNNQNQVVAISSEEKIMDLSASGGGKADTVKSDGILVLDRTGKTIWKWSVFDVLDPLKDPQIVQDRSDWMHANSLTIDEDGNYILSFYNNAQIWKIDARTGKLIWKLGRGGDLDLPGNDQFENSHAVHRNSRHELMLFDNGTARRQSRAMAFQLDEPNKTAVLAWQVQLPKDVYSERMGSAYLINDTTVLNTCSKRNVVALTNKEGRFLWALRTAFVPYRVEFIPAAQLAPYIVNKD